MRKKTLQHDTSLNNDKRPSIKKVSWGEDQTRNIAPNLGRKQLVEAINSGDPVLIYNVLQNINHDKAEKYLTANEGLRMGGSLMKIAKSNFHQGIHDSEALKKVISIFMEFDQGMIRKSYAGFQIYSIRNKDSEITNQFLTDYHEAIRTFNNIREEHKTTVLKEENSDGLPQEEAKGMGNYDASTADNQEVRTRVTLSFASDEDEIRIHHDTQKNKIIESSSEEGVDPASLLNHMLSWIYQLPEYLQNQILNSAPVKSLTEYMEQMTVIYDVKNVEAFLAKLLPAAQEVIEDSAEYYISDKVTVSESSTDAIDMSMILEDSAVNGWILPMVDMESGFDPTLNEMTYLYGNGFDIF